MGSCVCAPQQNSLSIGSSGSIARITALQQQWPVHLSQQTLEVGSRYLVLRNTSAKSHVSPRSDGRFAPTVRRSAALKAIADCKPCLSRESPKFFLRINGLHTLERLIFGRFSL